MTRDAYRKAIERIVKKMFDAGTPDRIQAEIKKFNRRRNVKAEIAQTARGVVGDVQESARAEFAGAREAFHEFAQSELEKVYESFDRKVFEAVRSALRRGKSSEYVRQTIERLGTTEASHVEAVANTIEMASVRNGAMAEHLANGVEYFRYVGPSAGARTWCAKMLGKVLKISEIEKLINDFGQSALYFCGGWNCRHHWEPVLAEELPALGLAA